VPSGLQHRMAVDWWGFAYAAALALGGFMGYKRRGSVVSLIAGLFFGSVSAYGAYKISNDPHDYWTFLTAAGVLTLVMGMRFRKSGKLMPAGITAGLRYNSEVCVMEMSDVA
uniref:Zgc:163080 n=1 Tax=Cyprinus carpio TaxID=7962 RepID=A0A8C2DCS0_CYPCA